MDKTRYEPNFIRAWREHRKLSLDALGELAEINKGNLSKVERAINPWNQQMLENIAKALNTKVVDLLSRHPSAPEPVYRTYERATPDVRVMIDAAAEALVKTSKSQSR